MCTHKATGDAMQAPTTRTAIPGNLAGNAWYRAVAVTGVSTSHELWINASGDEAVYIRTPRDEPADVEVPAWVFITMGSGIEQFNQQVAAEDWVITQARAEVRAEMSVPS